MLNNLQNLRPKSCKRELSWRPAQMFSLFSFNSLSEYTIHKQTAIVLFKKICKGEETFSIFDEI